MRMIGLAAAVLVAMVVGSAQAQSTLANGGQAENWSDLGREATIDRVSERLANINVNFRRSYISASDDAGLIEALVNSAIEQVLDLRDYLSSNPHIRLSTFSVGFPEGVSVEFSFPPAE